MRLILLLNDTETHDTYDTYPTALIYFQPTLTHIPVDNQRSY